MTKEQLLPDEDLARSALLLARRFIQRWDMYPKQIDDGTYVTIHQPLYPTHLIAHLQGELTLGAYLLNKDSHTRFTVLDADDETSWQQLWQLAPRLLEEGIYSYLEKSRRGGHQWFFFSNWVSGEEARDFGKGLMACYQLGKVDLFPRQDRLGDGPGSLIRLPFGIHSLTGKRYGFYAPTGKKLAPTISDQIQALAHPQIVSGVGLAAYRSYAAPEPVTTSLAPLKREKAPGATAIPEDMPLSEQIKQSISVRDFVGQYVKLSSSDKGLCPFHDDHRPSFAVNDEGNYWQCFTCGIGGSVIDFWMKWRDINFATAVKELAEMLL